MAEQTQERDNFTNQKPFVLTADSMWCTKEYLRKKCKCGLCGHKFEIGETMRWQYTNDTPGAGGNPFVCVNCDGTKEEIVARIKQIRSQRAALNGLIA